MSHLKSTLPKMKCTPLLVALVTGLLLLVVMYSHVERIVTKVVSGAGMEHCCSIEGVVFNYTGVFLLLCGALAVLVLSLVFWVRDWLLRTDFERKYGVKLPASRRGTAQVDGPDFPSMHGYQHRDDD